MYAGQLLGVTIPTVAIQILEMRGVWDAEGRTIEVWTPKATPPKSGQPTLPSSVQVSDLRFYSETIYIWNETLAILGRAIILRSVRLNDFASLELQPWCLHWSSE